MATLFVSDVHLSARRPEVVDAFEAFVDDRARRGDAVYVLGDLVD
jgi:UDP-2,3-diacylglucosamine hydrolase